MIKGVTMFEKEAEEYASNVFNPVQEKFFITRGLVQGHIAVAFKDGAEFGYNKANEWHYVKDGDLPPEDTKVLALMAEKEICIAHFYRRNVWDKIGTVIAWREFPKKENE